MEGRQFTASASSPQQAINSAIAKALVALNMKSPAANLKFRVINLETQVWLDDSSQPLPETYQATIQLIGVAEVKSVEAQPEPRPLANHGIRHELPDGWHGFTFLGHFDHGALKMDLFTFNHHGFIRQFYARYSSHPTHYFILSDSDLTMLSRDLGSRSIVDSRLDAGSKALMEARRVFRELEAKKEGK